MSPFNILTGVARPPQRTPARNRNPAHTILRLQKKIAFGPKAICANSRAASAATTGKAPPHCCPPTSTTKPFLGSSPRRSPRPISKSPKAATIPAPSASFPTCAASSARAASSRSWPKPSSWSPAACSEITLIGQDTTCYGEDLGLKDGLATLLDALARIEGLRWLRFLYAYPNRITGKLLETIARHDNICKYLDVPLQHASPTILKAMKRGAGADIFLRTLEKVRATVPGIAIRTTFIVGFPGETISDYELLQEFITAAKFDWLGVFGYSHEEGSGAFSLTAQVPKRTIEARKRRIMKLQQSISKKAKQQWVGRELVVLAEGESEETPLLWEARTQFHAPEIDGKVYINDMGDLETLEPGRFYRAEITEAHDYDIVARILSGPLEQ